MSRTELREEIYRLCDEAGFTATLVHGDYQIYMVQDADGTVLITDYASTVVDYLRGI